MTTLQKKIPAVLQGVSTSLSAINKTLRQKFQTSRQVDSIQARVKDSSHLNIIIKKNGATMTFSVPWGMQV